jgi:prolyl-tRNA synthetase
VHRREKRGEQAQLFDPAEHLLAAEAAEVARLEQALEAAGVEVLVDDREERPGVKFKDADLVGIPLRVVVGGRGLKEGKLELKWRTKAEAEMIGLDGAAKAIADLVAAERAKYA